MAAASFQCVEREVPRPEKTNERMHYMLKVKLSSLLFAVLASMSLAVYAAEKQTQPAPVVESAVHRLAYC